MPPYSSYLSSIETVFAVLKQRLGKHMARLPKELSQNEFEMEVKKVCDKITHEHNGQKLFMAARKDLIKALE